MEKEKKADGARVVLLKEALGLPQGLLRLMTWLFKRCHFAQKLTDYLPLATGVSLALLMLILHN